MSYLQALLKNIPAEELSKINQENEERKQKEEEEKKREFKPKKNFSNTKKSSKKSGQKNKNSLRKKKDDDKSESVSKADFFEALKKAQDLMMESCKPSDEDDKTISESLGSEGWKGHKVNVDLSVDEMSVKHDNRDFNFSKSRVVSGRHFVQEIQKMYQDKYENVNVKCYQPKNSNNYVINVMSSSS